ncbi:DUF6049 family protein [Actinomycetaceae bacterium MB13-C1-2]|nr:DUF6049 family protein [Actinomycetaceae bacterium MB13-C1-2]
MSAHRTPPIWGSEHHRSLLRWFLTTAVAIAVTFALSPLASADPEFEDEESQIRVTLREISPAVLTSEKQISIRINIAGVSEDYGTRVGVYMSADALKSMDSVESFLEHGGYVWNVGEIRLSDEQQRQAATEAGVDVTLEFSVDELPLWNPDDWGPYGLDIRVLQPTGGPRSGIGIARGLMLWYDKTAQGQTHLNALVSDAWQAKEGEWPKLSREGVTLGLQPDQAVTFSKNSGSSGEVLVLPSRAADISMLAATGETPLLDLALGSRTSAKVPEGASWVQNAVLTYEPWLAMSSLNTAAGGPVLSPPKGIPGEPRWSPSEKYSIDPQTGSALAESAEGSSVVLGSFGELSQIFSDPELDQYPPQHREQLLRASTAIAAKLSEDESPRLWVNVEAFSGQERLTLEQSESRLSALFDVPWIKGISLRETLDGEDFGEPSGTIPVAPQADPAEITHLLDPVSKATRLALAVIGDESGETSELTALAHAALAPATVGMSLEERTKVATDTERAIMEVYNVVEIVPSQSVNIMGPNADFPVTISNKGKSPIALEVGLLPSNHLIQASEWVKTTVPANSTTSVNVPVRAVGSGSVSVILEAKTADGTLLASSPAVSVRSRPGMGDAITWVVGSGLAALFVLGLVRTFQKGRRGGVGLPAAENPGDKNEVAQ